MIISITHEHDLDGLGSQAILKRYYDLKKENLILFYAHYIDFTEKINRILEKNPDKLFITDLGFNTDFLNVFKSFKLAKTKGTQIFWFDHHIVGEEIKEKIQKFCKKYINDTKRCAAEIVQTYLLPNDDIARRIAALAHDSDFKDNNLDMSKELQLIIEYNRGELKNQEKKLIVDLLSKGDFENNWFKSQLKDLNDWYNEQSQHALNRVIKIPLSSDEEFLISYAELGGGKITDLLKEKYNDRFAYIGIDSRFNEIIIQSSNFNCRDFTRSFGGGGHKNRAGFTYKNLFKNDLLDPRFISEIIKSLNFYI